MNKGKVIYIGGFELPDKNAAAHRVLSNAKVLKDLGYDVIFIDVDKTLGYDKKTIIKKEKVQGFNRWSISYPKKKNHWIPYLTKIDNIIEIISKYSNIKYIICYNYPAIALYNLKRFCNKRKIKIIGDCTEWYSTKGTNLIFKIIKGFDSFLRMRVFQKKLDGMIVISRYLEKYYKNSKSIICIPPLVDLYEEKWKCESIKKKDKLNLVYAGVPGKNKDKINLIIESLYKLKEFDNYTFNILGITKKQYLSYYDEHIEILEELSERVKFIGWISHYESIKYIKQSDFTVFIREETRVTKAGFPTKYVESISCGTPVLTNKNSDLKEYLLEGVNGYFFENNSKENIVEGIKHILSLDNKQIKQMKSNCKANNPFEYYKYNTKMREFLQSI